MVLSGFHPYETDKKVPVIAEGLVFMPYSGGVEALEPMTGQSVWKYPFPSGDVGTIPWLSYGGGRVYATTRNGGSYALAAQTGAVAWSKVGTRNSNYGFEGPATYSAGKIFLPSSFTFIAEDAATGAYVWVQITT